MLLLMTLLACVDPNPSDGEWLLTWEDDFEGDAGAPPDGDVWVHDVGGGGWGNNQLEFNTDRVENAALDGQGHLAITALREAYEGNDFTSARLKTKGRFDQAGGRFEARIRLPEGQGLWPAFWLLGANIDEVGWPWCGELDVLEAQGEVPATVYGTAHGPGASGAGGIGGHYTLSDGSFADDFHDLAVEIDPGHVAWYVDGVLYQRLSEGDLPPNAVWIYDEPIFVLLNLAVGGHFVAPPTDATPFPATMLVDWVRVSERGW